MEKRLTLTTLQSCISRALAIVSDRRYKDNKRINSFYESLGFDINNEISWFTILCDDQLDEVL